MKSIRNLFSRLFILAILLFLSSFQFGQKNKSHKPSSPETYEEKTIGVSVNAADGTYSIFDPASHKSILRSQVAVEVDHHWLKASDYPQHSSSHENVSDDLGPATQVTVSNTGLHDQPDLNYSVQLHSAPEFVTIRVMVRNHSSSPVAVQAFRSVASAGPMIADLGGPDSSDRVLSDSFSEDRPGIKIHDLVDVTDGMHRAVGSQLIYNRDSKRSLFLGTLASEKFLTVLRLHVDKDHISSYEVESTGTTELEKENSLSESAPEDQIELSLPLASNAELSSEPLLISTGTDYHQQLETYGSIIRQVHHARTSAPSIAGWWSWTAYYFGLNQGTALTNATWLAQNLLDLGYNFFHIDEGYQYARGEYITPDASFFPEGMQVLESKIHGLGLTPGIWTAPFEVSERSWVFQNHKEWLVHNAAENPIHAGWVIGRGHLDALYMLDCTHPGAQDYLRKTYTTLTKDWGIRYIKLDFMDDSAIEGVHYKANATALETQRIGLQTIREAVGDDVLLDKDGSVMLNPVGIVDMGRISVDTGHKFEASKEAAPGIAARYYMNRNFYVADPDAFTVSRQTVGEQAWHGGKTPLTLDEARVSIALAAVSGGMYEIGDDLPTLGSDPERVALVKNEDLRNMSRLGRASLPLDLMSYAAEDGMPSTFLLQESRRQVILTVFNWTEKARERNIDLSQDLKLQLHGHNQVTDVLDGNLSVASNQDSIALVLAPHSVKVLKIIDTSVPPAAPNATIHSPDRAKAGETVRFSADADPSGVPVLAYRWEFDDGTHGNGAVVSHAYTHAGDFSVHLVASGLDGVPFEKSISLRVEGRIDTRFAPAQKVRLSQMP